MMAKWLFVMTEVALCDGKGAVMKPMVAFYGVNIIILVTLIVSLLSVMVSLL